MRVENKTGMEPLDYSETPFHAMDEAQQKYLYGYLDKVAENFSVTSQKYTAEANSTERSLSGQLILLNTVIFTASIFAIGSNLELNGFQRFLVLVIFASQIGSIISGIVNYFKIEKFYTDQAVIDHKKAHVIKRGEYNTISEMGKKLSEVDENEMKISHRPALHIQVALLVASLVFFLLLVTTVFFTFSISSK